jgi:DNA-directed RNA polymerase subunit RPC12/RpoP
MMDKYGVETEKPVKTADDKPKCPNCGKPIEDPEKTGVPLCPDDGSKPFEKKPD